MSIRVWRPASRRACCSPRGMSGPRARSVPASARAPYRLLGRFPPSSHILTHRALPPASLAIQPLGDGSGDIRWGYLWGPWAGGAPLHAPLQGLHGSFAQPLRQLLPRRHGRALGQVAVAVPGPSTRCGRSPLRQARLHCSAGTPALPVGTVTGRWSGDRFVCVSRMSGTQSALCNCTR